MASYRTITGTVLHITGDPWAGTRVKFSLFKADFTNEAVYPPDEYSTTTQNDGTFSVELWCNDTGDVATEYVCYLPNNDHFRFVLPEGDPTTLSELRAAGLPPTDKQAVVLGMFDEHKETFATADTLGHIKLGSGLSIDNNGAVSVTAGAGADLTFRHIQASAATVWDVTHSLGKYPAVTVRTSSGDEVEGDVSHIDQNTCRLTFSAPFAGEASFN